MCKLRVVYTIYTGPQPRYLQHLQRVIYTTFTPHLQHIYSSFTAQLQGLHYLHHLHRMVDTRLQHIYSTFTAHLQHIYSSVNTEVVAHLHRFTPFTAYPQELNTLWSAAGPRGPRPQGQPGEILKAGTKWYISQEHTSATNLKCHSNMLCRVQ